MGRDVLARDHGLVEDRDACPFLRCHAPYKHAPALDVGGNSPDFRRDRAHPRQSSQIVGQARGQGAEDGAEAFSRMTITPSIRLSVSPTRFRSPLETLNRPITPRIGTDSPISARIVRSGRVSRLRQAKTPMFDDPELGPVHDDRAVRARLCHCPRPPASIDEIIADPNAEPTDEPVDDKRLNRRDRCRMASTG